LPWASHRARYTRRPRAPHGGIATGGRHASPVPPHPLRPEIIATLARIGRSTGNWCAWVRNVLTDIGHPEYWLNGWPPSPPLGASAADRARAAQVQQRDSRIALPYRPYSSRPSGVRPSPHTVFSTRNMLDSSVAASSASTAARAPTIIGWPCTSGTDLAVVPEPLKDVALGDPRLVRRAHVTGRSHGIVHGCKWRRRGRRGRRQQPR
jgi:hypothetical protein